MAFTINRIMAESGDEAIFEIVSTGDAVGTGDSTTIDVDGGGVGDLANPVTWGGTAPNMEVLGVSALVCGPVNGFVTLAWQTPPGPGTTTFLTLAHGQTESRLKFRSSNVGDDIVISSVQPGAGVLVPFTLRLRVRKLSGFAFSSVKP